MQSRLQNISNWKLENGEYCVTCTLQRVSLIVIPFCLSVCLSVILWPTAYHDWSITTKFGRQVYTCPRTCVSLFGSPVSHTLGARGENMQNFAYFQRVFLPLWTWRIVPYDLFTFTNYVPGTSHVCDERSSLEKIQVIDNNGLAETFESNPQDRDSTTTTTTTTTILRPFVRDYSGQPVPEEIFTDSHPSWSSTILYQLPPSTMIHSILCVQYTCLTVLLHNLS